MLHFIIFLHNQTSDFLLFLPISYKDVIISRPQNLPSAFLADFQQKNRHLKS